MYESIILGPGAIRGICILGAFFELEMNKVIDRKHIKNFAGISIGAVLALFLSMDIDVRSIYKMFNQRLNHRVRILSVLTDFGLDDGRGVEAMLHEQMGEQHHMTFQEHYEKFGKGLYVQATNLNMLQAEIYSYKTHPNMKISQAIRRSVSIPLFFQPVLCDTTNHHFVDGALVSDHELISYFDPSTTLVIELKADDPTHPERLTTFPSFFQQILILLLHRRSSSDESGCCRLQISSSVFCHAGRLLWETPEELRALWWQGRKAAAKQFAGALQNSSDGIEGRKPEVT